MTIELIEKISTRTSKGVLSKAWYKIDNDICLVKGNSLGSRGVIGYEPYSEAMASRIAGYFGLDFVPYTLENALLFSDVKVYDIQFVSVCKYYIPFDCTTVSLETFLVSVLGRTPKEDEYLPLISDLLDINQLYKILVFDAFIGNEDRHVHNIDVIIDKFGGVRLAPIYDNGGSLLAWRSNNELGAAGMVGRFDKAKPFRTTHAKQIKLVPKGFFPKTDPAVLLEGVFRSIDPILDLLPRQRSSAIKVYLSWRIKYLIALMG